MYIFITKNEGKLTHQDPILRFCHSTFCPTFRIRLVRVSMRSLNILGEKHTDCLQLHGPNTRPPGIRGSGKPRLNSSHTPDTGSALSEYPEILR